MKLNDIQLCRAAALIDGLRLFNEKNVADKLDENQLAALQTFTIEKGTRYAEVYGVDFPDETIPESLLATLTRGVGRPSAEENERVAALADGWADIEARESEAYNQ